MSLTQQWQYLYLNLTRNSLYIFFSAKSIVSFREVTSSLLYVCVKETC